jgi:hypothetical protein
MKIGEQGKNTCFYNLAETKNGQAVGLDRLGIM